MAEQRYRDKRYLKFGGGGETVTLKAVEHVKKVTSSSCGDHGGSGLFSIYYFKTLPYNWNRKRPNDFSLGGWDVLGGVILAGIVSHGGQTIVLNLRTMMQPIFNSPRARSLAKRIVDLCGGSAVPRVRLYRPIWGRDCWDGLDMKENVETLDFGRDTNRLDYFRVTPFDVHVDNDLRGIANYGGGFRTRQVSIGNSSYNGRGCGEMVGPRLDQERGNTGEARQVAVGIFANNEARNGEVVIERLEEERGGAGNVDGSESCIDGEEGGRFVWWNNWWLLLALWK